MSHQGGGVGIFIYIPRTAIDIAKRSCVVHVLNLCFQIMVFVSTRKLSKVFVQLGDSVMIRKAMPFDQWLAAPGYHSPSCHLFHPADRFCLQGINLYQKSNAEWLCGLWEGLYYMQVTTQKTARAANPLGIWWRVLLSMPKLDRAASLINRC